MRRSIEKLAYLLARERGETTIGDLAAKYGETSERVMDAIDVVKIVHGQPTQIPPVPWGSE